jgi:hypothetical protein
MQDEEALQKRSLQCRLRGLSSSSPFAHREENIESKTAGAARATHTK